MYKCLSPPTVHSCSLIIFATELKSVSDFNFNVSVCTHNMDQYVDMDQGKGPGQVLNLTQIVKRFYQQSTSS